MNDKGGLYEYIEMPYLLAGVKSKLGLRETTSEDLFLTDAINFCLVHKMQNFGSETYVVTQIPIENDGNPRAKLPKGFKRFVQKNPIIYTNAAGRSTIGTEGQTVTNTYTTNNGDLIGSVVVESGIPNRSFYAPSFINNTFFKDSPFDSNFILGGTVTQIDGYLYFSSNVTAEFVKIAYLGVNFGENGKMLIPAYFEEALVNWAAKEWSMQQFSITGESKYYQMLQLFERSFITGRNKAKAIPLMPSSLEYDLMNYTMKTLI